MTKGALVAFLVFFAVVVFGFVRTEQIAGRQRHVLKVQQALLADNSAILDVRGPILREQGRALAEVCRQAEVLRGIVESRADVDQFNISHGLVAPVAVPIVQKTIVIFRRYQAALSERAACRQILNP